MSKGNLFNPLWGISMATSAIGATVLIAQPARAAVQVTGVRINPTASGIEIILETADGEIPQIYSGSFGETFFADIINTQLRLPQDNRFQQANPSENIASVTVEQRTNNTIRVTVVGRTDVPTVQVNSSSGGLVLSVADSSAPISRPPEGTTEPTPETTQPTTQEPTVDETFTETETEEIFITVTAQRTEEDVQDVPISITVLTEEQIEDADIDSFEGVADNAPNFTFFSGGGNRSTSFYSIRGISNFNLSTRDAVGFFVDDVPYGFAGFIDVELNDIERIEVLRGPQNTLYGRSSLGGVVNVITRRPTNEFEFRNSLSYANYDHFESQLSVSGPIVEDELFFRLSGLYYTKDGYVENTLLDEDINDGFGYNIRGKLLWTPSEEWEITFNTSFDDYREGAVAYVPDDDDPFDAELDFNGFNDLISNAQSLRIAYTDPDFRATLITTRRFSNQNGQLDADYSPADILINTTDFDSTTWTQEIRLQSPEGAEQFQWILGGYFETSNFTEDRPFINGIDSALPGIEQIDGEFDNRTLAVFGQVSYQPIEQVNLIAGLRYESTNSEIELFENTFIPTVGEPLTTLSLRNLETDGSEVLPRFVVEYNFNEDVMAYGSISKGYRPPGPNFNPFNEATAIFEGERSWNYEIGLKSSLLSDRVFLNIAVFHSPIDNFQFPSFGPDGSFIIDTADAKTTGAELEIRANPIDGLDIIAGLGILQAEFTGGISPFTGETLDGNKLPYAPNLTYNLAVQYRQPDGGFFGRLELVGFGTTNFDDINTVQQDPYALVNARLGYEFDNYGIYFFANNIFDNTYKTQAFDSFSPVGVVGTFGAPATFGIQFRSEW